jgi:hypothetical protein
MLQWKINNYYIFWVCVCSLRNRACNVHASCHLWLVQLYNIFPHYLINGTFKKVIAYKMCVLIFSTTFVWNIFHSTKNWERFDQKCISVFMWSAVILVRFEWNLNCLDSFKKYANVKILENPSNWSPIILCRQTDRHDEANSRFLQFCERP